eukprot:gb/GEZN01026009.1/.p1 GENE.gb/GEZN01026009.1/~~gb/GEZN01026009.1/.p1  ORF type:complete len:146 (-),score=30.30 gb/GEZN01026009.1/:46-483(-)
MPHIPSDSEIQEAWLFFSEGDGNVPVSDLGGLMRSLGMTPTEGEVDSLRSQLDNGEGWVDWELFWGLATAEPKDTRKDEEELKEAFKVFDKDGNGMISAQELRHVMTTLGECLSETEAADMQKYLDVDGDGQINYQEFTAVILKQ